MAKKVVIKEYQLRFALENGTDVCVLVFENFSQSHFYTYRYLLLDEDEDVEVVNEFELIVGYKAGLADSCKMSMNIVFPKRRGQENRYGLDLSKNSKLFLSFEYEKEANEIFKADGNNEGLIFRLKEVGVGHKLHDVGKEGENALIKQHDFPFPVPDVIKMEFGRFEVPFLFRDGDKDVVRNIKFVNNINRPLRLY